MTDATERLVREMAEFSTFRTNTREAIIRLEAKVAQNEQRAEMRLSNMDKNLSEIKEELKTQGKESRDEHKIKNNQTRAMFWGVIILLASQLFDIISSGSFPIG